MEDIGYRAPGYSSGKLRLLHVIQLLDPAGGGAVAAAKSMCAALAERGHDVTLYATDEHPEQTGNSEGYRTVAFPMEYPPMAVSVAFARAFQRLKDVDIVHIHQLYRFPQSFAAFFCRRHAIPYCIQPHGSLDPVVYFKRERRTTKRLYEILIEKRNLRHAAGLIYTAQGEKDAANFLNLTSPSFIVPLGLDLSQLGGSAGRFRSRHGLEGKELVVWMGRLVPVKGLDVLITAFAALARQRPNIMLALVGPDTENYAMNLRQLMMHLDLSPERVIFTGLLHGQEKFAALREADVFVLPSFTENFALAAVEAMAMGAPVIVSSGVKIAPDIAAAGAGVVVAPEASALQSAITEMLNDSERRARMGAAARAFAQGFDWPAVVGRLEEVYRAMIAA